MTDDLVYDTIRSGLLRARSHPILSDDGFDYHAETQAILADLAGSLVQPGMVAVPVEDLRLAISSVQTVPRLNALSRLHERLRSGGGT